MVVARPVKRAPDIKEVKSLIKEHYEKTDSPRAKELLENWDLTLTKLIRVIAKRKIRSRKSRGRARSRCRGGLTFLNLKRPLIPEKIGRSVFLLLFYFSVIRIYHTWFFDPPGLSLIASIDSLRSSKGPSAYESSLGLGLIYGPFSLSNQRKVPLTILHRLDSLKSTRPPMAFPP